MRHAYYEEPGPANRVLRIGDGPAPARPGRGSRAGHGLRGQPVRRQDAEPRRQRPSRVSCDPAQRRGRGRHGDRRRRRSCTGRGAGLDLDAQWKRRHGTAAEAVALPSEQAVHLPDPLPFAVGASLGVTWLTAWRAVHYRERRPDEKTMLVAGGAGAVGHYAIQLAKRAGYRVMATVSSAEKAAVARAAGADATVDYRRDDLASAVAEFTAGCGIDRIVEVDLAGNAGHYAGLLHRGGFVVAYGSRDWTAALPLRDWMLHGVELAVFIVYELPSEVRTRALADASTVLADPTFRHLVAARFPLERIAEAHEAVESGTMIGNVVLDI
jgi:NADPH:quinone reductase